MLRPFGMGAFHCGVEVHGLEWSFSDTSDFDDTEVSGIFFVTPTLADGHRHLESMCLGYTDLSSSEVLNVIDRLDMHWRGESYDVLERNCCHFCSVLCRQLGVDGVPDWVLCLPAKAAMLQHGLRGLRKHRQQLLEVTAAACVGHCCEEEIRGVEVIHVDTDEVAPSAQAATAKRIVQL